MLPHKIYDSCFILVDDMCTYCDQNRGNIGITKKRTCWPFLFYSPNKARTIVSMTMTLQKFDTIFPL